MASTLFQPATLGPLTLRNRFIKAATFEGRTHGSAVSSDLIEFHRRVAAGGAAMTTVAYLAVAPGGRTDENAIWLRPEVVGGLRDLTDAVHTEGALAAAQIGHAGPVANASSNRAPAYAPGRFFNPLGMRRTRAADEADIARITSEFATGTRLAVQAGFDALEVHLGHNYLLSSFLSPLLNRRDDRWGGSLENRARFARQVLHAVRDTAGDRVAVTAKLNMTDGVRGGFDIDESLQVAQWLADDGTIDALELTGGSSLANPMFLFKGDTPVREFRKTLPWFLRPGFAAVGSKFLRQYPYHEAYFREMASR
ncbi:MAG: NADH:flavin oxidoreductase [Microthrixaceae bacterium]